MLPLWALRNTFSKATSVSTRHFLANHYTAPGCLKYLCYNQFYVPCLFFIKTTCTIIFIKIIVQNTSLGVESKDPNQNASTNSLKMKQLVNYQSNDQIINFNVINIRLIKAINYYVSIMTFCLTWL